MLDRFQGIEVLLKVAELGSLSGAARALHMSPTMATKHVAAIEERLGVRLFHRTTRKVTPTEIGRSYIEATQRVLADLHEAEAVAAADKLEVRGLLRVNVPVSFGTTEIAPVLDELLEAHPGLTIDLGLNDRLVDLVEEGWDLAIRIGRLRDSPMIARRLAPCTLAVCASPSYLANHGRPKTVADLAHHRCLGYTLSSSVGANSWSFGKGGEVVVPVTGPLRAGNGDALMAAAMRGLGVIYQPTFIVAEAVAAGRLEILELDHPPFDIGNVYAVYPPNQHLPAKVRVFIDFLVARFASAPPWQRRIDEALQAA
ncbi:LysR family transcriptional regulator [Sphingomonas fennica]|uniref:LysR family transcriptional regulator n=1 Tax=Edaphosphingomonas fennica TaxID=114404 RepID=A0A2T4HLW0_9SPHN|nr:LysR family transcriptional regulator [Sphingomonas fennica]PTD16793.1 LysR family transcriptional regulator [Sphingomonas fennica]